MSRRRITIAALLGAPTAWALADLLLRRDLPGAAWLQHLAFRALVVPMEWLTEGSGARLRAVLVLWALVLATAIAGRKRAWAKVVLLVSAVAVVAGEAVTVALAVLMERGLALGVAVGVAVWLWRRPPSEEVEARGRAPVLVVASLAAAASVYYLYAMFMTRGSGYPLLERLGDALRIGGTSFFVPWAVAVGLVAAATLAVQRARLRLLALAVLPGVIAGALGSPLGALVLVPAAVGLTALLGPTLWSVDGPARWPLRLALPAILAGLLLGHTYSARVLACPGPEVEGLELLARPGETFRIARADDALVLSLRQERRLARVALDGGELTGVMAGPLAPPSSLSRGAPGELHGHPEELVAAPEVDAFFASIVPADPRAWAPDGSSDSVHNLVATLDGRGEQIIDAFAIPGLCWINTLHWAGPERFLYIGCEEVPGLHRYDPAGAGLLDGNEAPALGDVQDIAFGRGVLADRLFTISLWRSRFLSVLDRATLEITAQVEIGGTHYHLAYDPATQRLFSSGYYAGRVRVVDAEAGRRLASLPGGFGTREVAVHEGRRLLLASSTYDGLLRAWSLDGAPKLVDAIPVGGHVKDIRVDEEGDRAWLWSQCGLYELDLATVGAE